MKLISLKDQNLDGSPLKTGQLFEKSEKTGRFLIAMKLARPADEPDVKKRGTYKRRDMRAES